MFKGVLSISKRTYALLLMQFCIACFVFIFYMIESLFGITYGLFLEVAKWILLILFFWTAITARLTDFEWTHPYFIFLIAFFTFLLGRIFLDVIGIIDFGVWETHGNKSFSPYFQLSTIKQLTFALLFMHFGALFGKEYGRHYPISQWEEDPWLQRLGLLTFWVFLIPALLYWKEILVFVLENGYRGLVIHKGNLVTGNLLFRLSEDFYKAGFLLFLAGKPSVKKLWLPTLIYILVLISTLITGRRVYMFTQVLMLVAYFGFRGLVSKKIMIAIASILVVLAVAVGYYRSLTNFELAEVKYYEAGAEFLSSQGVSAYTVGLTVQYIEDGSIRHDLRYLYYPFTSYLSTLFHSLIGSESIKANIDKNYKLADRISYRFLGAKSFSEGNGTGSSFVAEFYALAGSFGVIIMSFVIMALYIGLIERWKVSPIGMYLILCGLPFFFYANRADFIVLWTDLIKPVVLLIFLIFIKTNLQYINHRA
jgi:hypothetical protein